jgi:hypothetical protein
MLDDRQLRTPKVGQRHRLCLGAVSCRSTADICTGVVAESGKALVFDPVIIAVRLRDLWAEPARSNSDTRASMSSISRALARTTSAARSRVPADTFESTMIFNTVATAAPEASCSRAIDWQKAVRRASVRGLELRILGPPLEGVRTDPYRAGRRLHIFVEEQRGNGLFLLVVEFCAIS